MAVLTFVKKTGEEILKKGLDKVFKRVIKGSKGSPFKNVDDLGSYPSFRNVKDLPGTEIKKLKMIGEKIKKANKVKNRNKESAKIFDQANKVRGGLKYGGRMGYKSAGSVCKLATKGKGNAYGKNS